MAFIVEDGTGLSNATAYIDVAFADDYHADRLNALWASATTPLKEAAIIRATDQIDRGYRFQGIKKVRDSTSGPPPQALEWPRQRVRTRTELDEVPDDAVPVPVQKATAEQALSALTTDPTDAPILVDLDADGSGSQTISQTQKAGDLSVSTTDKRRSRKVYHKVRDLLWDLLAGDEMLRA